MAITSSNTQILGENTATYTAAAGSNRMVVIICGDYHESGTPVISNCVFGAQAATALTGSITSIWSNKGVTHRVFYIKESDIPAGANAIAWDLDGVTNDLAAGWNRDVCLVTTLIGVDQAATPYFENPVSEDNVPALNAKNINASFGANQGKYALSSCIVRSGDLAFEDNGGTIVANKGSSLATDLRGTVAKNYIHASISEISSLATNSEVLTWTVDYTDSATSSDYYSTGHPVLVAHALVFDAVGASPAITIDQASIEPGGTVSGSYSGFQIGTPPTTPLSISDGTNTVSAAVTITPTNPDDGTGTFTGTVPGLPGAGTSGSFVLFGNITATLDDA